jgi:3-deoxy-D-manno-octulosonic acid kinase
VWLVENPFSRLLYVHPKCLYNRRPMIARKIEGFEVVEVPGDRGGTLVVSRSARNRVLDAGLAEPDQAESSSRVAAWTCGGRAPHPVVRVDGDLWVVKSYRRGGWVARWNNEHYLSYERFFRELEVCARALREGVPTVLPIALVVKRNIMGFCRAWLISPFIEGSFNLAELILDARQAQADFPHKTMVTVFRAAGKAVRCMHRAGIDHQDLNLKNLLVAKAPRAAQKNEERVLILDWDRARVRAKEDDGFAFKNLLRLYRSALKLRSNVQLLAPCLRGFLRGYFQDDIPGLQRLRTYYSHRKFTEILLHRIFWT